MDAQTVLFSAVFMERRWSANNLIGGDNCRIHRSRVLSVEGFDFWEKITPDPYCNRLLYLI